MKKLYCLILAFLMFTSVMAKLPDTLSVSTLQFVQNDGQWDSQILFAARIHGGTVFSESNGFTIALLSSDQLVQFYDHKFSGKEQKNIDAAAYRMSFIGASEQVEVMPYGICSHYCNYFVGSDRARWHGRIPIYKALRYHTLYSGIDLLVTQNSSLLKYEFYIQPYADPTQISIRYDGVQSLKLLDGHLMVQTPVAKVIELPPVAYQIDEVGDTLWVSCRYVVSKNTLSFHLDSYDKSRALVIDPVLVFSSYSGSESDNWGYTATYDSEGNLYGGGICFGVDYPTTLGAYQIDFAGGRTDISISKFSHFSSS